jgi:ribosomal protein S18 acetylase RimI-like enzyme
MEHEDRLAIRRALPEDAGRLQQLYVEASRWIRCEKGIAQWKVESFTEEYVGMLLREHDVFIACMAGEAAPVGSFNIQWDYEAIWGDQFHTNAGYVHRLAVSRQYKGQGIGASLLAAAEAQIRDRGKAWLRLDCMADNPSLNKYYLNQGMTFRGRFDGSGWSANLYERAIAGTDRTDTK